MNNMHIVYAFVRRLERIGITVKLVGNYPWIYLDTVNDKKVRGTFQANHGFTAFWLPLDRNEPIRFSNMREVFKKVRETLGE